MENSLNIGKKVGLSVYQILDQSFKSIKNMSQIDDQIDLSKDPHYGELKPQGSPITYNKVTNVNVYNENV